MPRIAKTKPQAEAAAPAQRQQSDDEIRYELVRRLVVLLGNWRACPRRVCRRRRACAPRALDCPSPKRPARVLTPEQEAAEMARLHHTVKRRLAEMGEEE